MVARACMQVCVCVCAKVPAHLALVVRASSGLGSLDGGASVHAGEWGLWDAVPVE